MRVAIARSWVGSDRSFHDSRKQARPHPQSRKHLSLPPSRELHVTSTAARQGPADGVGARAAIPLWNGRPLRREGEVFTRLLQDLEGGIESQSGAHWVTPLSSPTLSSIFSDCFCISGVHNLSWACMRWAVGAGALPARREKIPKISPSGLMWLRSDPQLDTQTHSHLTTPDRYLGCACGGLFAIGLRFEVVRQSLGIKVVVSLTILGAALDSDSEVSRQSCDSLGA